MAHALAAVNQVTGEMNAPLVTGQTHQEGRKLSDEFSDLCVMDSMSGGFDFSESVDDTDNTPRAGRLFGVRVLSRKCSREAQISYFSLGGDRVSRHGTCRD